MTPARTIGFSRNYAPVVSLLFASAVSACSVINTTTPSNDGGAEAAAAPLACLEIFQCAADCTGTGCEDACAARGSTDAKAAVTDVVNCYTANKCADGPCLQTNCAKEIGACGAQAAPAGGTPVTTVPSASAPPTTLAGKWHSFYEPNQATRDWTFNTDGTTKYYNTGAYDMPGGCKWGLITDSTGTIVVEGDKVTYFQTAGTQQSSQCGVAKTEPAPKSSYAYRWSIAPNGQLSLVDLNSQNCINNPQWDSCHKTFDRQ